MTSSGPNTKFRIEHKICMDQLQDESDDNNFFCNKFDTFNLILFRISQNDMHKKCCIIFFVWEIIFINFVKQKNILCFNILFFMFGQWL